MELMAEKADQTVYEGEGGGYYAWSSSKSPLLSEFKLAAGKLVLHPLGFAIPHYSDSSKIAFVIQGSFTVGLVPPNSSEETVVVIKKGDVLPLLKGVVSWWFNGADTNSSIIFLGETTKAQVPGEITYFFMAGVLGILHGFQSEVAKIFNLDNKDAKDLVTSQPGVVIVKLGNGIEFPKPSEHIKTKIYATIDTSSTDVVVVKGGGIVNSLTERDFPVLGAMGLSARFVRLEGKAMLAPSYVPDGSVQVIYVAKGRCRIQIVSHEGKPAFDDELGEDELLIVPRFVTVSATADENGMELFSVVTSSNPVFAQLAGQVSVWKALSPVVLQSALNISPKLEQLSKSKNAESSTIIPSRN